MQKFASAWIACVLATAAATALAADPPAVAPTPAPDPGDGQGQGGQTLAQFRDDLTQRRPGLVTELSSGDADRVAKATLEIDDWAKGAVASRRADLYEILVDTQHYAEAEDRLTKGLLKAPASNFAVEHLQKVRVKSFLKQGKTKEALAAAKAYYDVTRLAETRDGIAMVATCLLAAHPDDPAIVKRFKDQQVAGAMATTQPGGANLGDPILPAIPAEDPPPVSIAEAEARVPTDYIKFEAKGNLLLLVGKPAEAKSAFDQALVIATEKQKAGAIENVARAIRDQAGTVGPANAYLATVQPKK